MNDSQLPLVSVPVITYNSSNTVVETLDSIFNQTYPNLELVLSDDGSTDNTIQICREWIEAHKDRFVRAELLTVEKNTGISANLNRAERVCQGAWVKGIAGDDRLVPDCIASFMEFTSNNPDAQCIFGRVKCFGGTAELRSLYEQDRYRKDFFSLSIDQQLRCLILEGYCIPSAGYFYNRQFIQQLGVQNDDRIPLMEYYPKWINLLKKNVRFYLLDKVVVEYRLGSGVSTNGEINIQGYRSAQLFNVYYRYPELIAMGEYEAINYEVEELTNIYYHKITAERVKSSYPYRIGRMVLKPLKWIANLFGIKRNAE